MNILNTQFYYFQNLDHSQFNNLRRKSTLQFDSCIHSGKHSFHIVMKKMLLDLVKFMTNNML